MEAIVGSGRHTYKVHEDWAHVPADIEMKPPMFVEVGGTVTDTEARRVEINKN